MPTSKPHSTGSTTATDVLFALLMGALALAVVLAHAAWLGGNLATVLTGADPWAPYRPADALLHPHQLWPATDHTALLTGRLGAPGLLLAAAGAVTVYWRNRRTPGSRPRKVDGLARSRDLAPLLRRQTTVKTRSLRPSLAGGKKIAPRETGIRLGALTGTRHEVRMSFEDVALAVMAPRSGKTTALAIPAILDAPGPVLLTSNKAAHDAYTATLKARAAMGRTWTMDPQRIAHADRAMWWNPLTGARTLDGARRLAGHFVAASTDASARGDFWTTAAQNVLTQLFLAAATDDRPITDVVDWLATPADRTPIDALRDGGHTAIAAQLKGTIDAPPETRDGIFETARQYTACLLDSDIAAWITPHTDVAEFRPEQFVTGRDTLYLLSKDGGGSASPLIAACADAVLRAATRRAERAGGRLDPPLLAVLDEAANVCKISDLPDLYSHLGSRGVIPLTILQSYRQGVRVWGDVGMDALWSAATIKLIGAGIDDPDFADRLSRLIGDHEVPTTSTSRSDTGTTRSTSTRTERILPADKIRALPKGTALLLATGLRAALLTLRPWYTQPDADQIAAASTRDAEAITTRARTHHTGTEA